ncbi:hypothetical protein [Mesorhizobium sp. B263B2A]|uniref:hypothetical protein n=1 Tax=Mesorhizobium sp. B263B2A TaxID=2876669 RepID=UPI001CD18295|nr:hypothetical protein [Mesorhizobium sp. B263B2A]MCA0032712.1 hypothetical protein [Mesorhizobium sp. B263B2A]
MTFVVDMADANGTGNGDICVRTDKGTLVALIYASANALEAATLAVTALNGWRPMNEAPKDGKTLVLLALKDENDDWINVEGWYEPGIADRQWYDIYHGPVEPKFWRPRLNPPVQP